MLPSIGSLKPCRYCANHRVLMSVLAFNSGMAISAIFPECVPTNNELRVGLKVKGLPPIEKSSPFSGARGKRNPPMRTRSENWTSGCDDGSWADAFNPDSKMSAKTAHTRTQQCFHIKSFLD